ADNTTTVSIQETTGGNFESLQTTGTVSHTSVDDNDVTTLTLTSSTDGHAIAEGGTITYTVTAGAEVKGESLVVTLSNGQTVTIPVGSTAGSVTLDVRADDEYAQGTETLQEVTITGHTGGNFEAVTTQGAVNNTVIEGDTTGDNDTTTVTLTATPDSGNLTEGDTVVYTVTADRTVTDQPLVITLTDGTAITIPVGERTASSDPQTLRADDIYTQTDSTTTVSIQETTGGNFESLQTAGTVSHTSVDDNDVTTLTLTSSTDGHAIAEGGTITYTVTAGAEVKQQPLTVTLSNGQTVTIPVGST
ncbi:MAG: type I secretion protein, partial [Planctomycetes bacterium]|nr:type I secretion protein [Planctomycetota bacterium]